MIFNLDRLSSNATEQDSLFLLLDEWAQKGGANALGMFVSNSGLRVQPTKLFNELRSLAETTGIGWRIKDPAALGMTMGYDNQWSEKSR